MRGKRAKELRRLAAVLVPGGTDAQRLTKRTIEKQERYRGKIRKRLCDIVFYPKTSRRRIYRDMKAEYTSRPAPMRAKMLQALREAAATISRHAAEARAKTA